MTRDQGDRPYDAVLYLPRLGPALAPGKASHPGGAETQMAMVASGLARRGRRIAAVVFDTQEGLPSRIDGVDIVVRRPYPRLKVLEPLVVAGALRKAPATCVVQRAGSFDTAFAAASARITRTPFVFAAASDADFHQDELPYKPGERALCRRAIRTATEIVVQTERQVELCETALGRTPVLVKSIARAGPVFEGRREEVLWIARVSSYKHPGAYVELARKLKGIRCSMVAIPDPAWPEGTAVLSEAATVANLEVLPGLPRADAVERIRRAAVVVSTSTGDGMPNIFLEAWAHGVPTIALYTDPVGNMESRRLGHCAHGSVDLCAEQVRAEWERRDDDPDRSARQGYIRLEHDPDVVLDRWADLLADVAGRQTPDRV